MSEVPDCPYCGSAVRTQQVMDYDSKIKLRCNNCGGFFEFMPGFGAFTLPDEERRGSRSSVRYEGSAPGYQYDVYEADTPWGTETPPVQGSGCGAACVLIFCFCFILPIIWFVMWIIFGFGFFLF